MEKMENLEQMEKNSHWRNGKPLVSMAFLVFLILGCVFADILEVKDPAYMDLSHISQAPNREFLFGTDHLGRDLFSMVWHGGRISLFIGFLATAISTFLAAVIGTFSGISSLWVDACVMRFADIFLSIPSLLLAIFLQAILGKPTPLTISCVIGMTSWAGMAKVVRAEVRQMRNSEYVQASRCMGAGFFHILGRHLAPHFFASIQFMVVMNVRNAILAESTLSFLGMGLPLEVLSWGSILSLSERALMTGAWWVVLIPGAFLAATLLCLTNIASQRNDPRQIAMG